MSTQKAQLSNGKTAYTILGNRNAKHLVLVFGGFHFPRNCDAFFNDLNDSLGFDYGIILYDYFGRGESDAPDGLYDVNFYMKQAEELIHEIHKDHRSYDVIGYSFGGSIATHFAYRHPEKVNRLILSGAWGTWEPFPAATYWMTKLGMANVLYKAYWKAMPGALKKGFNQPDQAIIDNMLKVENEIISRTESNLKKAILSTFRNFARNTQDIVKSIATHPRKVLLVWGDNDQIAPYKFAKAMHAVMPQSALVGLDGNHNDLWLVPDKAKKLKEEMIKFLKEEN
ncbi:MAG: alpha/beta hydrolase [Chitinophagales bacterium]